MSFRSKLLGLFAFISIGAIVLGYFLLTKTHTDFTKCVRGVSILFWHASIRTPYTVYDVDVRFVEANAPTSRRPCGPSGPSLGQCFSFRSGMVHMCMQESMMFWSSDVQIDVLTNVPINGQQ